MGQTCTPSEPQEQGERLWSGMSAVTLQDEGETLLMMRWPACPGRHLFDSGSIRAAVAFLQAESLRSSVRLLGRRVSTPAALPGLWSGTVPVLPVLCGLAAWRPGWGQWLSCPAGCSAAP